MKQLNLIRVSQTHSIHIMSRRRQSFGGSLHQNQSNRLPIRSPSSATKRRTSFGGFGFPSTDDMSLESTEQKDRRTMLEEWRAQLHAKKSSNPNLLASVDPKEDHVAGVGVEESQPEENKENHQSMNSSFHSLQMQHSALKSSTTTTSVDLNSSIVSSASLTSMGGAVNGGEGLTAVERFRLRRKQRLFGEGNHNNVGMPPPVPLSSTDRSTTSTHMGVAAAPATSQSICFDDEPMSFSRTSSKISSSTPSRRMSMLSGPARRSRPKSGGRKSISSFSSFTPATSFMDDSSTVDSGIPDTVVDNTSILNPTEVAISMEEQQPSSTVVHSIDDAEPGLKSRIVLMEKRIQELEKEKMSLSMSKAPLEARLRQKEDQWSKEKVKFEQEIDALMNASKVESEKFSTIENELEQIQEENRSLKFELRKQKALGNEGGDGMDDKFSRQLQNDRALAEYKEKFRAAEEEIRALRLEKVSIESEVNATNLELAALIRDFDSLQEEYETLAAQKESNQEAEIQLEELAKEHTAALAQLNATSGELASLKTQSKFDMMQKEQKWNEEKERLLFEMSVMKTRAAVQESEQDSNASEDEAVLRARIEERDRRIAQLEAEVLKGEQIRRDMHNRIQELRGNIRVFVRTRPFLPGDNGETRSCLDLHPDGENLEIDYKGKLQNFKFDKVFPPSAGQDIVFHEVSEFVQSALDGYHVCLFSYGQTGSGKTHTMQGSGNSNMRGIIPRAVEQILTQAKNMQKQKWKFTMSASFLEIYNEELKDLLVNMNEGEIIQGAGYKDDGKLVIRRDRDGHSYVDGLRKVTINTDDSEQGMQGLKNLMAAAARSRSVASTKMNAVSSRSHSVFMLHLHGENDEDGTIVDGALNLCDLAGSERLDRSGAANDAQRLKETQSINKSLSCLGDVFTALSNGSTHVPYRNSKLTYLLQDCLSGDGKALMFVNLSPTLESSNESLCSLRFAQRVNQVELGKATKHISYAKK